MERIGFCEDQLTTIIEEIKNYEENQIEVFEDQIHQKNQSRLEWIEQYLKEVEKLDEYQLSWHEKQFKKNQKQNRIHEIEDYIQNKDEAIQYKTENVQRENTRKLQKEILEIEEEKKKLKKQKKKKQRKSEQKRCRLLLCCSQVCGQQF